MQFFKKILFSTKTTAILFLSLSISMAFATFIENKYSTNIAKTFIYESTWFEILILIIILNLIGNIYKYKLWNKKKIPILIFHLSFIIIFIGGFLSRYFSNEGTIYLRKGFINNKVFSNKNYIKIGINYKNKKKLYYEPYNLSYLNKNYENKFFIDEKNLLKIKIINYIPCAKIFISKKNPIEKIIKIISINEGERIESFIENKKFLKINNIYFSLNKNNKNGIKIFEKEGKTYIKSTFPIKRVDMINGKHFFINKNKTNILKKKCLYETYINSKKKIYWVIPEGIIKGELKYVKSCKKEDEKNTSNIFYITANIFFHDKNRIINFIGKKNNIKMSLPITIDNYKISIGYGSIYWDLPFYLSLNNFIVKNYPGSDFPSYYTSNLTLKDNNISKNYTIYMNKILKYKGYRLFQSGYDPDKKGTHIIVNNDWIGTIFSYVGYLFMIIGMLFTIFCKGSRFNYLKNKLKHYGN
ncbi:cytochrome c biogenesis protein ResB [Blattabacterium cuenoti]|uniref:cytochrome c biogenesis protein ResB n=1 Tax=Blattabacterium cuenoti TaxID=1653831 RepID=UPI001EEC5B25|nr:cytochrome c biogenesis protein ResB [Blattabacterium cuenoti]